jgi:hypothetical protein
MLSELEPLGRVEAEKKLASFGDGAFFLRKKDGENKVVISYVQPRARGMGAGLSTDSKTYGHCMMTLFEDISNRDSRWVYKGEVLEEGTMLEAASGILVDEGVRTPFAIPTAFDKSSSA